MTLKDLVQAKIVGDEEPITIAKKLGLFQSYDVRLGCWYEDQILDFFNSEIESFTWSFRKGLTVIVR